MSLQTPQDLALQITVPNDKPGAAPLISSERRITPSWTVEQLKTKLEPITGIPASSQSLRTRGIDGTYITLDDESSLVGDARYGLRRGAEIEVRLTPSTLFLHSCLLLDLRPPPPLPPTTMVC
jgi:tubulin-specific chaperone B